MAKYYGSTYAINGTSGVGGRCAKYGIRSAAQTWDGSLIAIARDDREGNTVFEIEISDGSSLYGKEVFSGTLDELVEKLSINLPHSC